MKRKTLYLAGPMRGKPNHNIKNFNLAAERLGIMGWNVINPADISREFGLLYEPDNPRLLRAVMDAELAAIPHLDAIYLLRGWERSEGARAELKVAIENGKQILLEGAEE